MLRDQYIRFMSRAVRPADYAKYNVVFNLLGIQLCRIGFYQLKYRLRQTWYRAGSGTSGIASPLSSQFERDGLVAVANFFDAPTFDHFEQAYERIMMTLEYLPFRSGGFIRTVSISGLEDDKDKQFIYDLFTGHPLISQLVSHCLGRSKFRSPRVVLQDLYMPEGATDIGDSETELHADRLFHHPKLFFYVNPQNSENGAYIFAPRSHKYRNLWRLAYEYRLSVRAAFWKLRTRLNSIQPGERYKSIYETPAHDLARMEVSPLSVEGGANTLVMSDNRGFHARGLLQPGTVRRQVRIQYQYLVLPWYATLLLHFAAFFHPTTKRFYN